jgi:hypothetical protein
LKSLFGTATVADLYTLRTNLEQLKLKADISVNNQLTYIKGIDLNSRINSDAITNLSSILKNETVCCTAVTRSWLATFGSLMLPFRIVAL